MTRLAFGILAGVISGMAAWWYTSSMEQIRMLTPARPRGKVIFDNTPTVHDEAII